MREPPRARDAHMLTLRRLGKITAFGTTMAVGTLGVLHYGLQSGTEQHALTLAFTTFVLFQFFNIFNARADTGTAFNREFFANHLLWLALTGVIVLQIIAVNWPPAQEIFQTTQLTSTDWIVAILVAASVLVLEETRKLFKNLYNKKLHYLASVTAG
jgi:Ca2+-transporting ATPase